MKNLFHAGVVPVDHEVPHPPDRSSRPGRRKDRGKEHADPTTVSSEYIGPEFNRNGKTVHPSGKRNGIGDLGREPGIGERAILLEESLPSPSEKNDMASARQERTLGKDGPPPAVRDWIAVRILSGPYMPIPSSPPSEARDNPSSEKVSEPPEEWDDLVDCVLRGRLSYCGPLPEGLSPFDRQVLEETRKIPFGKTVTYGEIAKRIGRPRATRAVGGALRRNPLPLLIPCHRVVGRGGALTGYSGGIGIKEDLLAWERRANAP